MNRAEFDRKLRKSIRALPKADVRRFSEYYAEMLDDRIESGMTEEEAVAQLGDPAEIASQILSDVSLPEVERLYNRMNHKRSAWEIVLIVVGSPLWLAIALALFTVALSLLVALWSLIVVVWAMELAFALCVPGGIALGIMYIARGNVGAGIALIGAGIFCAGAAMLWFKFSKWATVSLVHAMVRLKDKIFKKKETQNG